MIRRVCEDDAQAIADIYNVYVCQTTVSFETAPVTVGEMRRRILEFSSAHPYYVYVDDDGTVQGYCYAHPWKERAAYGHTWETTIYLSASHRHHGVGTLLMKRLIDSCREQGAHVLVASITDGNSDSVGLHASLGFRQVSAFKEVGWKFGQWLGVVDMQLIL